MTERFHDPDVVDRVLRTATTIAVVGASPKPDRDSHQVALYLQSHGYAVIPVNPAATELLGVTCYPDVASIPDTPIDIVCVFRKPDAVPGIVDQVLARGDVRALWLQLEVIDEPSAIRAEEAGLAVVMNECIKVQHLLRAARER